MFKKSKTIPLAFEDRYEFADEETVVFSSIKEALDTAVERNLEILQGKKDVQIAKNNIKVANRLQNPSFEGLILFGESNIGQPEMYGLSWPIEINKRGYRKKMAISQRNWAQLDYENKVFQYKMDVRTAYVALAAAKSFVKVIKEQQDALKKMVGIARDRVSIGIAPESELLQAEVYLDQWNTTYNNALNTLRQAQYNFNSILSLDGNMNRGGVSYDIAEDDLPDVDKADIIRLKTPLPKDNVKDLQEVGKIAFLHRRDIQLARQEVDIAAKNLKVVASQRIPDVGLAGGIASVPKRLIPAEAPARGAIWGAYAGASISLPIVYRFTPEIRNAQLEVEKKEANFQLVQNVAKQDIKSAYSDFDIAKQNLNYYQDTLLTKSQTVLTQSQYSYQVGKTNLSNLILAGQFYLDLLSDYINALSTYYYSWIELLRASNVEEL